MSEKKMRSVEASRAIWQTGANLSTSERLLYQALASHADENMECHPSVRRLAEMTRLSERQIIRLLHGLRRKEYLLFDDNPGGLHKPNHYRLQLAINPDIGNPDTQQNPDISNAERVTSGAETLTGLHLNHDIVMSEEWFEGFEWLKKEWVKRRPLFRNLDEIVEEFEEAHDKVLEQVLSGDTLSGPAVCRVHGSFTQLAWISKNGVWLGVAGVRDPYDDGHDGCPACRAEVQEEFSKRPEIDGMWHQRSFELYSPAKCGKHGRFIFHGNLWEYPADGEWTRIRKGNRYQVSAEMCPNCESEMVDEMNIQDELSLTNEEMERGANGIIAARDYARGRIDATKYLDVLQNQIIPDLKSKQLDLISTPE